jgi:hypothetical protein
MQTEADIIEYIKNDSWMMSIMKMVQELNLPDWWIGAGFVRNRVWDYLHNYASHTPLNDVDVIYFDPEAKSEEVEKQMEDLLKEKDPDVNWSVKNQARMADMRGDGPYTNAEDGLSRWVETATCIGVRLEGREDLKLAAPLGIDDLIQLILRYNPKSKLDKKLFYDRIESKNWLKTWPNLHVIDA